ncbi:intracellular ribonuclease LX [Daucus carota subsp. sativus]|nr:PREDICTED: intracellular ribonuclease LX-like [Daucus carota subsp. sativus]
MKRERQQNIEMNFSILIQILALQCLAVVCVSREFDFYYFVQQWPASYCDTKRSCCYPKTGKPAEDFSIHGLWPNYRDGTYPANCDSVNLFNDSKITDLESRLEKDWPSLACPSSDGMRFWGHEWDKHGTCSESFLDQHSYFKAALDLKNKANLLQALNNAGIKPADGKYYSLESIKDAIKEATGYTPYIDCNVDASRKYHQLYQVYMCVEASGSEFINCPLLPHGRSCTSQVEFPSFSHIKPAHQEL